MRSLTSVGPLPPPDRDLGDPGESALSLVAEHLVHLARSALDGELSIHVQLNTVAAGDSDSGPTGTTEHTVTFRSMYGQSGRLTVWGDELDVQDLPVQLADIVALAESFLTVLGRSRAQSRMISQLEHAVSHDPLTGAVSRVLLEDRLRHARAAASRGNFEIGLIYLDLDDFKAFNDRHGHVAGDALLVAVAGRVMQAVRPADTVARLGGDEFLVVCESVSGMDELRLVVERIESSVSRPYRLNGTHDATYRPDVSAGATLLASNEDVDVAIRRADAAMYASKRRGRARSAPSIAATP